MKARLRVGLVILFLFVALIPPVNGEAWPEEQTRHIRDPTEPSLDADWFVTEGGHGFSTSLVTVLDPNTDIWAYLWFENMQINTYFYLINATLRLRTASSMDFDADSSITIYGVPDYRNEGSTYVGKSPYGSPASIMTSPLTSAHVTKNTSQFYGPQWWDIDVTNIVQELKSNPWYEGPGLVASDTGSNMAFIIQGASGFDTRYFYDLQAGNGYEAQLHLHWDFNPPLPPGYDSATFNGTYGAYEIWYLPGKLMIDYTFSEGTAEPDDKSYDTVHGAPSQAVVISTGTRLAGEINFGRNMVKTSENDLYYIYTKKLAGTGQTYVIKSEDDGATWIESTRISTGLGAEGYLTTYPAMAIDSNDVLHAIWNGKETGHTAHQSQYYSNYTGSWSTPIHIGRTGTAQGSSIAIDSNDTVHVVARNQVGGFYGIYYENYTVSGGWSPPNQLQLDLIDGMTVHNAGTATIEVDLEDNLQVVFTGASNTYSDGALWYKNRTASGWSTEFVISTYGGMSGSSQDYPSMTINSTGGLHIVWDGRASGFGNDQIWYVERGPSGWVTPTRISNATGMSDYPQVGPNVIADSGDGINIVWDGKADGMADENKVWFIRFNGTWSTPDAIQPIGKNVFPVQRWAMWPGMGESFEEGSWLVTDENGTILVDDLESFEDATDWIDDYDTDPEDPNPGSDWEKGPGGATGPFTRFRMRLYILILGFGAFFGPVLFFSWKRPTGYLLLCGAILMLMGVGLLMSITQI